jgi:hypothetical protein
MGLEQALHIAGSDGKGVKKSVKKTIPTFRADSGHVEA